MAGMLLSDDERKKFAAYLRQAAESNRLLVKQFDVMAHLAHMRVLRDRMEAEAHAQELVAGTLETSESFTVKG